MKTIILISTLLFSFNLNAIELSSFKEMKDRGGALILENESMHGFFRYIDKNKTYVVLKKIKSYEGKSAIWGNLDFITIPKYKITHQLIYGLCHHNGKFDGRIAAIVKRQDHEILSGAIFAWRANLKNGKIESISKAGITCSNEGYGV